MYIFSAVAGVLLIGLIGLIAIDASWNNELCDDCKWHWDEDRCDGRPNITSDDKQSQQSITTKPKWTTAATNNNNGNSTDDNKSLLDLSSVTDGISDFFRTNLTVIIAVGVTLGVLFLICCGLCCAFLLRATCCPAKIPVEVVKFPRPPPSSPSDVELSVGENAPLVPSQQQSSDPGPGRMRATGRPPAPCVVM